MVNEDKILAEELGKLGGIGGGVGGALSGGLVSGIGGFGSGSVGAYIASKFLPTESHQISLTLKAEPRIVLRDALSFLQTNGRVLDSSEAGSSEYPKISGTIGSGFAGLNPAVVHIEIVAVEEDECEVLLSGHAKEGWIKQRTAEKALERFAAHLSELRF